MRPTTRIALTAAIVLSAPGSTAHAQLGDPFTAPSLDATLRGLKVYQSRVADAAALRQQFYNAQSQRGKLLTDNDGPVSAYREAEAKHRNCVSESIDENRPNQQEALQKKMMAMVSDPVALNKFSQEYTALLQAATQAAEAKDTAASRRASEGLGKLMGADPTADTAAAMRKCGARPRPPAPVAEAARLEARVDSLSIRMRAAEGAADADGAKAAGVAVEKFRQMRERLETFLSKPSALLPAEVVLLGPRKAEIEAALKVP
jgi:hypothetical protein